VGYHAGIEGLFTDLNTLFRPGEGRRVSDMPAPHTKDDANDGSVVFIQLSPSMGLSFVLGETDTEEIQLFIASLRRGGVGRSSQSDWHLQSVRLCRVDVDPNVALWSLQELDQQLIRDLWRKSTCEEVSTSHTETLTIPKLYGNKSRMTPFLAAIARHYVPDAGEVCDLMSGTGIVSRVFSAFFKVYANDANDFAALLTRCQAVAISTKALSEFIEKMPSFYEQNAAALMELFGDSLSIEAGFLHGRVNSSALDQYKRYCEMFPYPIEGDPSAASAEPIPTNSAGRLGARIREMIVLRQQHPNSFPYCMATVYYSNAYFGLSQAIALDSIRFAIDKCMTGAFRDFCLAALLVTACSCASGPHFAQPPKIRSEGSMAEILEHRARDVLSEYSLILRLMAERQKEPARIEHVWNLDWRQALAQFDSVTKSAAVDRRGVYVDPPYTKLQYSRYYHVLNTILAYNYPDISGKGRYPPRSYRFSSRFEYQSSAAKKEFAELFQQCASMKAIIFLSYTSKGLVPIHHLVEEMEKVYPSLDLFCKRIRHHSQGVNIGKDRQMVTEYVIVGS